MSIPISKKTKFSDLINFRLKITILDGRTFTGQLLAFDKHMNMVLVDSEEARVTKASYRELAKNKSQNLGNQVKVNEEKRFLGLIILRGEQVVNVTIKSGPTSDVKKRLTQLKLGKGVSKPLIPSLLSRLRGPRRGNQ